MIPFVKYHGTGNDFILIDDRKSLLKIESSRIKDMCDRHFGIGADGLIQIREKKGFDFEMLYFNSDGLPGSMCGNGGRCAVAYAHSLDMIKDNAIFAAYDGSHEAKIISLNPEIVNLHMNDVREVELNPDFVFLDTGSPHYIMYSDRLNELDVVQEGRKIRFNERFKKEGTNVNFVMVSNGNVHVRTYERGVENETLSCGTGVTAAVLASFLSGKNISSGCQVHTPGGKLKVYFKRWMNGFTDVWLEGETKMVYSGEIDIS